MTISNKAQATGHVKLTEQGNRLAIKFLYDPAVIAKVKALSDRRFHSSDKRWTAALSIKNVEDLIAWGFAVDSAIENWLRDEILIHDGIDTSHLPLWRFQHTGVNFIESRGGRVLLCDEQGLGKMVQSLAWLSLQPDTAFPALIVPKASAKIKWERHVHKWIPGARCKPLFGEMRYSKNDLLRQDVIIANWDIIRHHAETLHDIGLRTGILDECQMMKERDAKRTKATQYSLDHAQHIISMSGTPIINRPVEFFNALHITKPSLFPKFWSYAQEYCDAKHNGFAWDFNGASNTDKLHNLLTSTIMIRRLKKDVLPDLPPKNYDIVPLEVHEGRHAATMREFEEWLRIDPSLSDKEYERELASKRSARSMVMREKARQAAVEAKLPGAVQWLDDFMESGKKLVLFAWHREALTKLERRYGNKCVWVQGEASYKQALIDKFQESDECQLAMGNMQSIGDSVDITAAEDVAFLELPSAPAEMRQCEDRVYGRLNDLHGANIHVLIAAGTVEEKYAQMLVDKDDVVSSVMDGGAAADSIFNRLVDHYSGRA